MTQLKHQIIKPEEIKIQAIRASGPGGQHVNKVSTAIELRFNVKSSSLSTRQKNRILRYNDQRITADGIIIIKAQDERSPKRNRELAIQRLEELISNACAVRKKRIPTQPTHASRIKRLESKSKRSQLKQMRKKVGTNDSE